LYEKDFIYSRIRWPVFYLLRMANITDPLFSKAGNDKEVTMTRQTRNFIAAALATVTVAVMSVLLVTPDYMVISRSDLMSLPTSGAAWDAVKASADANASPDLCNQDNKADVNALAAGIVYARTGDAAYKTKAVSLINQAMQSQRNGCNNAILAMGRQLGGYVLAADFAGYRDPAFLAWLETIVTQEVGGHSRWHQLRFTAYDSASNWGVHALASVTTVDIFLNRTADIDKDWQTFASYGVAYGGQFNTASSFNEDWSCHPVKVKDKLPIAINTPCIKSGINLDGAPVEDSSRSAFSSYSTYIHESLQGYAVMAQLWSRTGREGWTVNNGQVCRAAQFGNRAGKLNDSSVSYFVAHMANKFCGLNLPTKSPTSGGRMFGFSDYLFQNAPAVTPVPVTNTLISPTQTSTVVKTSTPIPATSTVIPSKTPTISATVTESPSVTPSVTPSPIFTPIQIFINGTPFTCPCRIEIP